MEGPYFSFVKNHPNADVTMAPVVFPQEKQSELSQQQAVGSLSEREKRAMAAEKRMASQLPHSSLVTQ